MASMASMASKTNGKDKATITARRDGAKNVWLFAR